MKTTRKKWLNILIVLAVLAGSLLFAVPKGHAEEDEPDLLAKYAILEDPETGQVLYEKNADQRMYPASMTKVMTGIVAMEHLTDLDEVVTISREMMGDLLVRNASIAGYYAGAKATVRDLFYALLMPSGADAANALAIRTAGTIPAFVELMNAKAAELGMTHTHFVNPHGLHEDDHYTTARDYLRLIDYARNVKFFREILSVPTYQADLKQFVSLPWREINSGNVYFPGFLGGKTGFTGMAGLCFSFYAEKDGLTLTGVIAGCPGEYETYNHLKTAGKLAAWGFDHYRRYQSPAEPVLLGNITVHHRYREETVPVYCSFEYENDIRKGQEPEIVASFPKEIVSENRSQEINIYARLMNGDDVLDQKVISVRIPREPNLLVRFFRTYGDFLKYMVLSALLVAAIFAGRKLIYRKRRL